MDEQAVREHAEAYCDALVSGDMGRAATHLSHELQANLGSLISILPLPLTGATVESIDAGGSGSVVVLRLVGESGEIGLQTRWKDRDGVPTIVEASHVVEVAAPEESAEADAEE